MTLDLPRHEQQVAESLLTPLYTSSSRMTKKMEEKTIWVGGSKGVLVVSGTAESTVGGIE